MPDSAPKSMYDDPTLYLYTSLTAGSSHIITATSRMETILKANRIPFQAIDCATDEKARMLWGRRAKGRRLPGLVKFGTIIGDLNEVEEWNEYGELKEQIDSASDLAGPIDAAPSKPVVAATPSKPDPPSRAASETRHISISEPSGGRKSSADLSSTTSAQNKAESPLSMAMRQAGAEAAAKAGQKKSSIPPTGQKTTATPTDTAPAPAPSLPPALLDVSEQSPGDLAEMAAAKTPELLATEGASRTSVDKIDSSPETKPMSPATMLESQPSREEQLLQMRRSSSVAKVPSKLSATTPAAEIPDPMPSSKEEAETAAKEEAEKAETKPKVLSPITSVSSGEITPTPMRQHRGSSLGDASKEEIALVEARNMIKEEEEDRMSIKSTEAKSSKNEQAVVTSPPSAAQSPTTTAKDSTSGLAAKVGPTDEEEEKATKATDPQKTDPKDADAAGLSVGD